MIFFSLDSTWNNLNGSISVLLNLVQIVILTYIPFVVRKISMEEPSLKKFTTEEIQEAISLIGEQCENLKSYKEMENLVNSTSIMFGDIDVHLSPLRDVLEEYNYFSFRKSSYDKIYTKLDNYLLKYEIILTDLDQIKKKNFTMDDYKKLFKEFYNGMKKFIPLFKSI